MNEKNLEKQMKEVIYENRIFHVKRKYTLLNVVQPIDKKSINLLDKPTRKESCFSKFVDNVISNRHLCRRGPFETPLPLILPEPRPKRLKTDTGISNGSTSRRLKTEKSSQYKIKMSWTEMKQIQEKERKELPSLETTKGSVSPIKVLKFMSKAVMRGYNLSPQQINKQKRNILNRKIDIEQINNEISGKLFCSSHI